MLYCYIVDDEINAINSLQALLQLYCPFVNVSGYSTNVADAASFLLSNETDILFLDIKMNGETGFDLMKKIPMYNGALIFVTAYDEYGLQAIKFSATDYLLKPVIPADLIAAVGKARKHKTLKQSQEQIAMLIQSFENQKRASQKKIALPDAEEIRYVLIDDIIYCQSNNSYTTFYLSGNKKIVVSKPISDYESLLAPYEFIRTHQSYLINKNKIAAFKKEDGGYFVMENQSIIPVSRQRKQLVKELF